MRRDYDIFEKFQDGSIHWRATIHGRFESQRKMHKLAERSENEFVAIDIQAQELLPFHMKSDFQSDAKPAHK